MNNNTKLTDKSDYYKTFYENVIPIKLTEGRRLKLHTTGWGILTDYYLESVKINNYKNKGEIESCAVIRVGDRSGHISCVLRGSIIGALFGLSKEDWKNVEQLSHCREQLFYRYFKSGLKETYNYEQKIFYNFCSSNQTTDILVATFKRCVNLRSKYKNDAFLHILDVRKCDNYVLDLYLNTLRSC